MKTLTTTLVQKYNWFAWTRSRRDDRSVLCSDATRRFFDFPLDTHIIDLVISTHKFAQSYRCMNTNEYMLQVKGCDKNYLVDIHVEFQIIINQFQRSQKNPKHFYVGIRY